MMRKALLSLSVLFVATVAYAQNPPAPTGGPLVLERIHDGWVLAPDFKVTDVDDRTGELAGADRWTADRQHAVDWRRRLLADQ